MRGSGRGDWRRLPLYFRYTKGDQGYLICRDRRLNFGEELRTAGTSRTRIVHIVQTRTGHPHYGYPALTGKGAELEPWILSLWNRGVVEMLPPKVRREAVEAWSCGFDGKELMTENGPQREMRWLVVVVLEVGVQVQPHASSRDVQYRVCKIPVTWNLVIPPLRYR
jgi:hypothetical protein